MAQGRLLVEFGPVGLLFLGYDNSRTKQAVTQPVTRSLPCHPVIDDIGVGLAGRAKLANLYPSAFGQIDNGAPDGSRGKATQLGDGFLADDHGVMLTEVGAQNVHHRAGSGLLCKYRPSFMGFPVSLNPCA